MVQQNTDKTPEHWQNNCKLAEKLEYHRKAEQENTSGTMGQQKRQREILLIQNCDILKRKHNRIQNQKVVFMKDFYGKVKPGQETFSRK